MKVNLYIRVSTDRQAREGDSLEEQESELKKFCEYRNFQIRNIYIERGKSGGNTNRPEYQKLLADIKAKKVEAVVVKKIDRLSRSLLDFEAFMKLAQENEIEFMSLRENFDTTLAMGKAMLRVALVFAQLEREQTSERISDVFEYRASQGIYNGGKHPYGYTSANKELIPYPKEKQVVALIFEHFLKTKSQVHTARFLNETGYRNRVGQLWDNRRIYDILRNPICIGIIRWKGNNYPGLHQPIITNRVFDEVQAILDKHKILKKNRYHAILKSLLSCGYCGELMPSCYALNRTKTKYYYYRCSSTQHKEKRKSQCPNKYIPLNSIETRFIDLMLSLSENTQFKAIELQINQYNHTLSTEKDNIQAQITTYETLIHDTKIKKEKYLDFLISSPFRSNERQLINDKIRELELEEKQTKAHLYRLQFELTEKTEEFIDLTEFKKSLISFKNNHESFSSDQLNEYIIDTIKNVVYYPDKLGIHFKSLPWKMEFVI